MSKMSPRANWGCFMIMRLYLKNKSNDRIRWIVSVIDNKWDCFLYSPIFVFQCQPWTIVSIFCNSSSVKSVCPMILMLSKICSGLEAPIKTLVTLSSFKIQLKAISARVWSRSPASTFKAWICASFSGVRADSFKKRPSVAMRSSRLGYHLSNGLSEVPEPEERMR